MYVNSEATMKVKVNGQSQTVTFEQPQIDSGDLADVATLDQAIRSKFNGHKIQDANTGGLVYVVNYALDLIARRQAAAKYGDVSFKTKLSAVRDEQVKRAGQGDLTLIEAEQTAQTDGNHTDWVNETYDEIR